jgi:hypothetical protein
LKPDPEDATKVIYKDKDGKTTTKAKPPGFDDFWKAKHPEEKKPTTATPTKDKTETKTETESGGSKVTGPN